MGIGTGVTFVFELEIPIAPVFWEEERRDKQDWHEFFHFQTGLANVIFLGLPFLSKFINLFNISRLFSLFLCN